MKDQVQKDKNKKIIQRMDQELNHRKEIPPLLTKNFKCS